MKKEKIYKIFCRMPTLESERLIYRPMTVRDAEDMYEYSRLASVTEYLCWSPHESIDYTKEYLKFINQKYRTGDFYDWGLVDKKSGKMIGTCGFTKFDLQNDPAETGYVLNPEFHGRGLATEALGRILDFGFDNLGLHRIESRFMVENKASFRVMQKNRMKFEGVRREAMYIKGKYRDIGVCAILRDEYFDGEGRQKKE